MAGGWGLESLFLAILAQERDFILLPPTLHYNMLLLLLLLLLSSTLLTNQRRCYTRPALLGLLAHVLLAVAALRSEAHSGCPPSWPPVAAVSGPAARSARPLAPDCTSLARSLALESFVIQFSCNYFDGLRARCIFMLTS